MAFGVVCSCGLEVAAVLIVTAMGAKEEEGKQNQQPAARN